MARTVKDPDIRRNEIVDVAQALFLSKGYDNTSVQDVLDGAGIAKGTFYHYFDSKVALLDALVARLTDAALAVVEPVVHNPDMAALDKLHTYFDTIMQWKTGQRRFLMDMAKVIYRDENALYREKMLSAAIRRIVPFFAVIIEQGIEEGVFHTKYAAETSAIVYNTMRSLSESMMDVILAKEYEGDMVADIERIIHSHEFAIARILGFDGELNLIDIESAKLWTEVAESRERAASAPVSP